MKQFILLTFSFLFFGTLNGQNTSTVFGVVKDLDTEEPIEFVSVFIKGTNIATETNSYGEYSIKVESNKNFTLVLSRIGYTESEFQIKSIPTNKKRNVNFEIAPKVSDVNVVIRGSKIEDVGMVREEVTEFKKLPTASGNFESILPHIALGTTGGTGGELSSQYNVRGGNYDENLVYVNDFEIFRPLLIRSSQQEGLSFPNVDLIRDVSFSSGGFESKYGDKMSSVLDIRYKRPDKFAASASVSFLGASAHIEGSKKLGANAYNKLRYLVGARYKTTQYLLGSLDVKGEFTPNFGDVQTFITYDLTKDLQIGFLGNFNKSQYNFIPQERVSASGLFTQVLQLTTVFEGQEEDGFQNVMGGLSLTFIPEKDKNPLFIKLLASYYNNYENEKFDILGYYRLAQVEFDLEGEGAVNEVGVLGVGTQQLYARNRLKNIISNVELKGGLELQSETKPINNFIQWGLKYQSEDVDDRLSEWERIDSAGYSIPFSESELFLSEVIKSENVIKSHRLRAYLQNSFNIQKDDQYEFKLTAGVRAHYWSFSGETNISPRFQLFYKPLSWKSDITFKLSGGVYAQPAFYKEIRSPQGVINPNIKAQKSTHLVAGFSYDFDWKSRSNKKFRFISEAYYKKLSNLVSYEIDNVRIRYSGINDAEGYVAGLDLRVNGEFVPGAESWINLSLLSAKENLLDVQHQTRSFGDTIATDIKYVPRPTNQAFSLSIFFQDYLPQNEDFKMNLNLSFGSGLPFGQKGNNKVFRNIFNFKPYQRVDIGFSYQIWHDSKRKKSPRHAFRFSRNSWVSLEIFNLLAISNVGSNTWIKTIGNQQYAIPNFLTSRRINLKFKVEI
ncbi:MAG: TonB-dependent receptor [Saprospiraceae bacterium]|nr:TonB-dependent receptor [Saprospiraceae bacterium]